MAQKDFEKSIVLNCTLERKRYREDIIEMVTRMTREELVDSSRKDFLNVLPNSWKEKLTIPATSYYVVITMYGFANDSEKEEYIRELIGPRLDSSFRFFSSCIPSSFFFFHFFFSLSLFHLSAVVLAFNRCRRSSTAGWNPPIAGVEIMGAGASNKTNYHINTGVSSSHYSCVPPTNILRHSIINHTLSWKSVFSYDFENSKPVIYKESRALRSSSLIIERARRSASLYYYDRCHRYFRSISFFRTSILEKNPIFSYFKTLLVDHRDQFREIFPSIRITFLETLLSLSLFTINAIKLEWISLILISSFFFLKSNNFRDEIYIGIFSPFLQFVI